MKKKLFIFLFVCVCVLMFSSKAFAMSEIGDNGVKLDNLFDANEKEVRRSSYLIKDIGKMKNPYDTVDLGMLYNGIFDISSLKKSGYRTIAVEVTIDAREIDDGYQYIQFFADVNDNTWLAGGKFELGHNYKITTYTTLYFYFEIDIANMLSNSFVIRYNASGYWNDDWENTNLKIQVAASKELRKTTNVWQLYKNNGGYTYTKLTSAE